MTAIFHREMHGYFRSLYAYVYMAFLLLFAGIFVSIVNLKSGYANFEYALQNMSFIFLIVIPILTMRVFAEERRQKTDQLLYSLPVSMTKVVLGKYLAMLVVLALPLFVIGLYPLLLSRFGTINYLTAYSTLCAFLFLAAALSSIGMFISSLAENQGVAVGVCFAAMLLLYFMTTLSSNFSSSASASVLALAVLVLVIGVVVWLLTKSVLLAGFLTVLLEALLVIAGTIWSSAFEGLFSKILGELSLFDRLETFTNGEFDLTSLVFYLTVSGLFLFLTVQSMEKRRWN